MLRESIDIADQIELGRFEPTADLEPRSVKFCLLVTFLSLTHTEAALQKKTGRTANHLWGSN